MCTILGPDDFKYGVSGTPVGSIEIKLCSVVDAGYLSSGDLQQGECRPSTPTPTPSLVSFLLRQSVCWLSFFSSDRTLYLSIYPSAYPSIVRYSPLSTLPSCDLRLLHETRDTYAPYLLLLPFTLPSYSFVYLVDGVYLFTYHMKCGLFFSTYHSYHFSSFLLSLSFLSSPTPSHRHPPR